ncbi:DUF5317 family protein [Acetobacterium bakii]|uniref:DUF5317 domain-containing protein n=1 Tax=Acetobacterium bakii TaxID=52689 RepID=A0A0L6TZU2_9FIRM|nr:DUF5317 family protein [Acetobacterium bakii]KNZ41763.1 hypothetical protein AKG39_08995 [Acetobacterium bakii]
MIIIFLIAILFAKFRGCEIKPAFKSVALYPPFIFEIIYLVLQVFVMTANYDVIVFAEIFKKMYLLSFLVPIIMLKLYKPGLIGSAFIVAGTAMNNFVIALNNGKMPVFPTLTYLTGYVKSDTFERINDIHVLGNADTKMIILADIFDVGWSILSIGDILIHSFAGIIVYFAIVELNKRKDEGFTLRPLILKPRQTEN